MFNFLVTGMNIGSPHGELIIPRDRVFLHTDMNLQNRYAPGGILDEASLVQFPAIFTNESNHHQEFPVNARIGKITRIRSGASNYQIEYLLDLEVPAIPNSVLEALATEMHFVLKGKSFGDFQTNHWAIKDVDLFKVLFKAEVSRFKPLVFNLPKQGVNKNLVGVMMPFEAGFNDVYATLKDAVDKAGMKCLRADDIWNDDVIIQDVVNLIGTAQFIICDLSNKNANVFYESGIAHTLGRPVILIARHESDIPFDLRHIRHIKYQSNEQGLSELKEKVLTRLKTLSLDD